MRCNIQQEDKLLLMPHTRDHWRDRHIFDRGIPGHQIQAHQVA